MDFEYLMVCTFCGLLNCLTYSWEEKCYIKNNFSNVKPINFVSLFVHQSLVGYLSYAK